MGSRPWRRWSRLHYGWVITAASLVIGITAYGVYYSFTLFYPFMVDEFGWSRTAVSGAMSVGLVAYGVFALPIGWCVDRLGPRLTIGIGGVLFGVGTFLARSRWRRTEAGHGL
jgi:MFS family permease